MELEINSLNDEQLVEKLQCLIAKEREATLEFLVYLNEFDNRKLYRDPGYSSLYDYCLKCLKYSESAAHRRITAARAVKKQPELGEMFVKGEVSLCSISVAYKSLEEGKTSPQELSGKSKREVEELVCAHLPLGAVPAETVRREVIRPVAVREAELSMFKERTPEVEERYTVKFSLSKDDFKRLEEVQCRLSSKLGKKPTVEALLNYFVSETLKPKKVQQVTKPQTVKTRYIPKSVRVEVRERDQHHCSFISASGVRCCERRHLQFDHVIPYARGGENTVSNLRLRCPAHNQLHAEECFGKEFIEKKIAHSPVNALLIDRDLAGV